MQAGVIFVDCPAYIDNSGSVRPGLPVVVEGRHTVRSTGRPL
jgi:hypothetical protein